MEWYIYETVALDHHTIGTATPFLRTIDARPAEFFSQRVKKLYISYSVTFPEAQRILAVCTGLSQLICWTESRQNGWLFPYLNPPSDSISHLTHLSIKLEMTTSENALPSFSDEMYQNLTHLEIVLPPPVNLGIYIDWRSLSDLPCLKHLMMGDLNSWDHFYLLPVLRSLLDFSLELETLVVVTKQSEMLEALEAENFDDPRLVILPRFNLARGFADVLEETT
ncbi:hypothetical protein BT96DRAFT_181828 [Gymnopus androsaceus JB14]|uniref:F-box domain-containing protein n=1 Tax=Gymnopus androsaceus JB14 TaxID=1447944 RepID=A0A6A4HA82_9AGAR|nr:hypothetical protein BT96DRAFT_181828 [Gymnopus androsaceus JB14]